MRFRPDRRRVLQLGSSGFLAWGLTPILGSCSRGSTQVVRTEAKDLENAWRLAQETRRPLLVLLADPRGPGNRGVQWSAYFDLASDEAMAELSSCELAFAVPDQVRAVIPSAALDETELSLAVLVEPEGSRAISVPAIRPEPTWFEFVDAAKPDPVRGWVVQLESAVRAALAPCRSAHSIDSRSNARELAESLRSRLRESAPAGGKWAKRFGGCGSIEFEDGSELERDAAVACGIAHTPENSRRFLWMFCERKS